MGRPPSRPVSTLERSWDCPGRRESGPGPTTGLSNVFGFSEPSPPLDPTSPLYLLTLPLLLLSPHFSATSCLPRNPSSLPFETALQTSRTQGKSPASSSLTAPLSRAPPLCTGKATFLPRKVSQARHLQAAPAQLKHPIVPLPTHLLPWVSKCRKKGGGSPWGGPACLGLVVRAGEVGFF